jgi:hypothetical protein
MEKSPRVASRTLVICGKRKWRHIGVQTCMDIFWLIPVGIVGIAFLVGFVAYMMRRPLSPSNPQVLVDKSSNEPTVDEADKARDWTKRPCGNFLEWLSKRS